jgi:hypothetical protein
LHQQQPQEGGFPGAAWTSQEDELTFVDGEGKILQRVQPPTVEFREMMRLDHAASAPEATGLFTWTGVTPE